MNLRRNLYIFVTGSLIFVHIVFGAKIGILAVMSDHTTWMTLQNQGSAINIANDQLLIDGVLENETFSIVWRDTFTQSDGVGNVVRLVQNENVDVIFGSPSSRNTIPAAHLTAHWNFPHISWAANSFDLADKTLFRTFVRTSGPISYVGSAIATLCESFNWKKIGFLYIDYGICSYTAQGTRAELVKYNITEMQNIAYARDSVITESVMDNYLRLLKQTSRIIFICVDDLLRRFLVRACQLGMCGGEFLFITTALDEPSENLWSVGDKNDDTAKAAFSYLFYLSTAKWVNEDDRRRLEKFEKEVLERMSEKPWLSNIAKQNNMSVGDSVQYLYDAAYFYGLWLNYSRLNGLDLRDGQAMFEFSLGLSFPGMGGSCDIGDNGDRITYFWIFQFLDGTPQIVAIAETIQNKIKESIGFQWFTIDQKPPLDEPICGYFGENCTDETNGSSVSLIIGLFASVMFVVLITTVVSIIRKRQLENMMLQSIWKVDINDIELLKSSAGVGSRISFKSQNKMSTGALQYQPQATTETCITVGLLKSQEVVIRNVAKLTQAMLTREDLIQLKTMRQLVHNNINPFIGATFDIASPCVIFQYCQKGSLQDILENDDIQLDSSFKYSLTMDLVQGMIFIHSSKLNCHGRLKSSNCLVDSRWVLKISDYGIGRYLDHNTNSVQEENERYKNLLWTAPEILVNQRLLPIGTKEGDVYSFSIIMHEIFYRLGPFAGHGHMTLKEIIDDISKRETPPCRPEIYNEVSSVPDHVIKVMKTCWNDNEAERPTFSLVRNYLKENIKDLNTNIVDIVLQRLEKYAGNLEDIVDQRTQQLMIEKQKADKLLYRMLPPSCADKLKLGEPVHPEIYDSSTIFFSDIVGFTGICAKSSPIEVVDLLNDLYTYFDDIIEKHDAYKVETIGDAYLVVSGVPQRNGNLHAGVIADMSLDILAGVGLFKIKHMSNETLKVRIGVHTGPCCAGVVGLSMPRYCLFGDTINTASRMESNGESQMIHISEATHNALQLLQGYKTRFRAELPIKGKGIMRTYWLLCKKDFCLADSTEI